jgi:pyruvate formate lyase activating enzyme
VDISAGLGLCLECIRTHTQESLGLAAAAHERSRSRFGLPGTPPDDPDGVPCKLCANRCRIPEGGRGYCGVRMNRNASLAGVSATQGNLSWYHDPLPTNCVASRVCAGETGAGYPWFAHRPGPEIGFTNLAVFFRACNFNCLYCQNWHFREDSAAGRLASVEELVADVDECTACICYFGGDPTPQLPFADEREIQGIARFVADLNPDIPYSLLAFHPQFRMADLPVTPRPLANRCLAAARQAGLKRVFLGNEHLLR